MKKEKMVLRGIYLTKTNDKKVVKKAPMIRGRKNYSAYVNNLVEKDGD